MSFYINKKKISIDINLAIARAFFPVEKELPYVLFHDGNVNNTYYKNLYWSEFLEELDENFKELPGFPSYKFNKSGECKSYKYKYPRKLKPGLDDNGYYFFSIRNEEGKETKFKRNRIIATIFLENPDNKPEVDHINRKRGDDRVENLRWVTSVENAENKDYVSFAEKLYKRIGKFDLDGNFIEEYKNSYEAAGSLNIENSDQIPRSLRKCASDNDGIFENKEFYSRHGYIWKYMLEKVKYNFSPNERVTPLKNEEMDSKYLITDSGNIINKKGYQLKYHMNGGYPSYILRINGKSKFKKRHILVATFFVEGKSDVNCIVHHKNENRMDSHYSNLEWTTSKMNSLYSSDKRRKPVDQFDKNGKYIKSFLSKHEAAEHLLKENAELNSTLKTISHCIGAIANKKEGTSFGYIWRYSDSSIPIPENVEITKSNSVKPVNQFSLEGIYIKTFPSIAEAKRETGINTIGPCCNGEYKKAGGYIWRFATSELQENLNLEEEEEDTGQYPKGPILQYKRNSRVLVKEHINIFSAAKEMNIKTQRIHDCCTGKLKTTVNFSWKYK